jgi:hypothetical protein
VTRAESGAATLLNPKTRTKFTRVQPVGNLNRQVDQGVER